ncbi:MAG: glycosyltransferase [Dongiaceae bacterium]
MPRPVVFVLKGYPRLSETFIAQEIRELERRGLDIRIVALRRPTDRAAHPIHGEIGAPVAYLPEYLYRAPWRVLRAWWRGRRRPGYGPARAAWLSDLRRDPTPNRVRRFGQALVLAEELPAETARLHAHFLHTPASVARYAALMTGLPWSCSAHAKDIWTTPEWEKREKLAAAAWVVTCTAHGRDHLAALAPAPGRVELAYHGLDFRRFALDPAARAAREGGARDGADAADPVRILSVGRAVEKKGYGDLLEALGRLPHHLSWRFVHVGGGPLLGALRRRARALGLAGRIEWCGPRAQDEVLRRYREADLFVLASRLAADGDRDGLPNVLMEAQSQALAVLATRVAAVPELVIEGVTGVLVEPGAPEALAAALAALIADPARRAALGEAGFARVHRQFGLAAGIDRLAERFGLGAAAARARPCA